MMMRCQHCGAAVLPEPPAPRRLGRITLDVAADRLLVARRTVWVRAYVRRVLAVMMRRPGIVWAPEVVAELADVSFDTVRTAVYELRRAGLEAAGGVVITTHLGMPYGTGYSIRVADAPDEAA